MSESVRATPLRDSAWLRVVLTHPRGNIVTAEMIRELRRLLPSLAENPHLKLVTIEGHGSDFSYGASVEEHAPGEIDRMLPDMHALIREMLDIPAPTAAIVRGRCLGGGFEIALACDVMFAAGDAVLGLPEIVLGVFPPAGSVLLPARIGLARSVRHVLGGAIRPVAEWAESGLIETIAPAARLEAEVTRWFDTYLVPRSAAALRHAVAALRLPLRSHVDRTLPPVERLYLDSLMRTHDAVEGLTAFLEKRKPMWTDT
ncbi:MAG: enoyl-CoA hydratase/isomerase family protein [Acidobacteria bacterium]|nr:enoyl-CoA hydratase/isomerase family protein [Acidobacteriota bacterium]